MQKKLQTLSLALITAFLIGIFLPIVPSVSAAESNLYFPLVFSHWAGDPTILYVTSINNDSDENYERMVNTLEGMGLIFHTLLDSQLATIDLTKYQLVIVAGSSFREINISTAAEQKIITALNSGVNFLWIGSGVWGASPYINLPRAFGISYIGYHLPQGIDEAEYADLDSKTARLRVRSEWLTEVSMAAGTAVEGRYYDHNTLKSMPFITSFQEGDKGRAVFISLPILDWWKDTEADYTFARSEILVKYIRKLTTKGYGAKHSAKNGKEGVFLLRLEDYTPGGTYMISGYPDYQVRMGALLNFLNQQGVKLNIAVIPYYAHPWFNEFYHWDDADQGIPTLKQHAQTARARGGSLIVHGYKHQNGIKETDYSGNDFEMWDEDLEQYLNLSQQEMVTDSAIQEAASQFNFAPKIWETPHYKGNSDTIQAAQRSGFQFFTESDTMLFPNYWGYQNISNRLLLNLPETGFDFRDVPSVQEVSIKKDHILPRLVRINAPYYIFYHNSTDEQYQALQKVALKAKTYDLWYPGLEEFGQFWKDRDKVLLSASFDPIGKKGTASVTNAFPGLTLTFRLPDGASPGSVVVNGAPVGSINKNVDGIPLVYVVLPVGGTVSVEVNYK